MKLSHIVACSLNHVIGKENKLPWHIPEDLKNFKRLTQHHTIIMGRKTFESIGKPLPNRRNIVISQTLRTPQVEVELVSSIEESLKLCSQDTEVFIIGGASIYAQTLNLVDTIYMTKVEKFIEGDSFYPEIPNTFDLIRNESHGAYTFLTYQK